MVEASSFSSGIPCFGYTYRGRGATASEPLTDGGAHSCSSAPRKNEPSRPPRDTGAWHTFLTRAAQAETLDAPAALLPWRHLAARGRRGAEWPHGGHFDPDRSRVRRLRGRVCQCSALFQSSARG